MRSSPKLYLERRSEDIAGVGYAVMTPDLTPGGEWSRVAQLRIHAEAGVYSFLPGTPWLAGGLVHPQEYAFGSRHVQNLLAHDPLRARVASRYVLLVHLYASELLVLGAAAPEIYPLDYSPESARARVAMWLSGAESYAPSAA